MTKAELVAKIAEKNGTSKDQAEASMNAILEVIQGELAAGNKLTLTGFWHLQRQREEGPHRSQPAHRQGNQDSGLQGRSVQARQGSEGSW